MSTFFISDSCLILLPNVKLPCFLYHEYKGQLTVSELVETPRDDNYESLLDVISAPYPSPELLEPVVYMFQKYVPELKHWVAARNYKFQLVYYNFGNDRPQYAEHARKYALIRLIVDKPLNAVQYIALYNNLNASVLNVADFAVQKYSNYFSMDKALQKDYIFISPDGSLSIFIRGTFFNRLYTYFSESDAKQLSNITGFGTEKLRIWLNQNVCSDMMVPLKVYKNPEELALMQTQLQKQFGTSGSENWLMCDNDQLSITYAQLNELRKNQIGNVLQLVANQSETSQVEELVLIVLNKECLYSVKLISQLAREENPRTKISVVVPNILDEDASQIHFHHVLVETYLLNNVTHIMNNNRSMKFNAKDSVVFMSRYKKYMIDNVRNMCIQNGRISLDSPTNLVYIGESTPHSQNANINIISPAVINYKTSYGIQKYVMTFEPQSAEIQEQTYTQAQRTLRVYEDSIFANKISSVVDKIANGNCLQVDSETVVYGTLLEECQTYWLYPCLYRNSLALCFCLKENITNTIYNYLETTNYDGYIRILSNVEYEDAETGAVLQLKIAPLSFSLQSANRIDRKLILRQIVINMLNNKRYSVEGLSTETIRITVGSMEMQFDQFRLRPGSLQVSISEVEKMAYSLVRNQLTVNMISSQEILPPDLFLWKNFIVNAARCQSYEYMLRNSPIFFNSYEKGRLIYQIYAAKKLQPNVFACYVDEHKFNKYLLTKFSQFSFKQNSMVTKFDEQPSLFDVLRTFRNLFSHFVEECVVLKGHVVYQKITDLGQLFDFFEAELPGIFYMVYDVWVQGEYQNSKYASS